MHLAPSVLRDFLTCLFMELQVPRHDAEIVAGHLVLSSQMGIDSHGLLRVAQYVEMLEQGEIKPAAPMVVVRESPACVVVDYGWNFGQVACQDVMERAMDRASACGVATGVAVHCTHAGRLGHYLETAAERGYLALGYCNSGRHGHWVAPFGGREGRLATNPIAFAAPSRHGPLIVSDFSTAAIPEGKLRILQQEGKEAPSGCIIDAEGKSIIDPNAFYGPPRGAILPFGGPAGYRGFALGILVEIMGGLLGGQSTTEASLGNGVSFTVYDPEHFTGKERFVDLVDTMADYLRSSPPDAHSNGVLLPGEREHLARVRCEREGIEVTPATWQPIVRCAEKYQISLPTALP